MKISPINNIQNNQRTQFKAKFSKADIGLLLNEIKGYDADLYPKLYTMLEYLNEIPGRVARFVSPDGHGNSWQVHINNKSLSGSKLFMNRYSALYSSVVNHKDNIIKYSDIVRMPENIFEQKWWANRHKKESDIKTLHSRYRKTKG